MKNPIPSIREYYGEVVSEVKKCTWPTKDELIETTIVVIVGVMILSAFVYVSDVIMQTVIKSLV
jgi:preprotein translocase subunit SecE